MAIETKTLSNATLVKKIVRLAKSRGLRPYRAYSGRCMFGSQCIGFYGEDAECAALAILVKKKTGKSFSRDSLGLDMIYYFPSIQDCR
jgi:hypothetical protein